MVLDDLRYLIFSIFFIIKRFCLLALISSFLHVSVLHAFTGSYTVEPPRRIPLVSLPLSRSVCLSLFDVSVESGWNRAGSHVHQFHPSSSGPGGRERMTGSREGADVLQELIRVHVHEGCHYAADRESCS